MHSDMDTKYHVISIVFAVGLHSTRPWVSGLCNSRVTRDYLVTYRVNKANGNQYPRFNIDPHCSNNTMSPTEPGKKNVSKKRIAKKNLCFFFTLFVCARGHTEGLRIETEYNIDYSHRDYKHIWKNVTRSRVARNHKPRQYNMQKK